MKGKLVIYSVIWSCKATNSLHLILGGKEACSVFLEQDDVIVIPLGPTTVHSVLTVEISLVEGSMFWDERNMLETLEGLIQLVEKVSTC